MIWLASYLKYLCWYITSILCYPSRRCISMKWCESLKNEYLQMCWLRQRRLNKWAFIEREPCCLKLITAITFLSRSLSTHLVWITTCSKSTRTRSSPSSSYPGGHTMFALRAMNPLATLLKMKRPQRNCPNRASCKQH